MHDQAVATFVFSPGICMRFNAKIDLVCYGLITINRRCAVFIFYIKNNLLQHIQNFHGTGLGFVKKRSSEHFINSRPMKGITGRLLINRGLMMACSQCQNQYPGNFVCVLCKTVL